MKAHVLNDWFEGQISRNPCPGSPMTATVFGYQERLRQMDDESTRTALEDLVTAARSSR